LTTITGNGTMRPFHMPIAGISLTLNNLTVTGSNASPAIFANETNTSLTLDEVVMSGNNNFSGLNGGAIFFSSNAGSLTISNSTFNSNNVGANRSGGAIHVGTGGGFVEISNSTFSGNWAASQGGAISVAFGSTTLTNVTIVGNTAGVGGGGLAQSGGTVTILNSIVADNTGGNCAGTISSSGYNLDSANTCGFASTGDLVNTDPLLGTLTDNGGQTATHAPATNSPVVDAGDPACGGATTDQRGVARPQDGDADGMATCDIGAVELGQMQCGLQADGSAFPTLSYPQASGVNITVPNTSEGTLDCIQVVEVGYSHPNATSSPLNDALETGKYWRIKGFE
ncbi:MAG: hypothetical protein KDD89_16180, partial [Anaerolineales bacterium]|nr:hypothetical protein [Anaerolineales bacterium]